jgi:predicted permease
MSWRRFLRRTAWDDERRRELEAHLQIEIDENVARGMTPAEARHAALRKLGNPTLIREEIFDMNTIRVVETVWQDLKYGARLLRRNPTFAVVAILTLALGTGANTAIFHLVDTVRLRTLPVERPGELVELRIDSRGKGRTGNFTGRRPMLTYALWERIRSDQPAFSSIMAWSGASFDLSGGGEVRPADGLLVSGTFFGTLGVQPVLGRLIVPADDTRGCEAAGAVLSHAFWTRQYGGDPAAVGRTILLDGRRFDVVGVAEPGFFGVEVGRSFDVALPLCTEPLFAPAGESALDNRRAWFLAAIARLRPGWTIDSATAQLRAMSPALFRETLPAGYVKEDSDAYLQFLLEAFAAGTGVSMLRARYSTPLWVLLGVTGLVLLITCANLANLMLARATAREREIGVRLAIGASRWRIARQLLSESLVLAVAGASAGLLIAGWLSDVLVGFLTTDRNRLVLDLGFDWRTFGFAVFVAAASCLLFGLAPAIRATRGGPARAVLGGRGTTDARERFTLRRALVVVQVALSLVLIVGAVLLARSLQNLMTLDPGFRTDGVLVVNADLTRAAIPAENRRFLFNQIVERLDGLHGVASAAEAFIAPMSGSGWNNRVVIDGRVQQTIVNFNRVGPGYFQTLATPLVAGRDFTADDTPESVPVAIVNELMAKKLFPNADPIGRRFHIEEAPGESGPRYEIVGVVKDTNYSSLRETPPPIAYLASTQEAEPLPYLQVLLGTDAPLTAVTPGVLQALREVNPAISVQFRTMDGFIRDGLAGERLMAALSGFFGVVALVIATVGLYGVMAYMVARRRMEIGIRMALGATRRSVVGMVLREATMLHATGIVFGAVLAVLGARSAAALLYGLEPWDPATMAAGIALLALVSLIASWLPAQRAARVEPTVALREE